MEAKRLFIVSGCNGAGKTTASFNILPDILNCKEFVNADEIARGISPFQPEKVSFEAGRIMLHRMNELLESKEDFAFETTLATKSFKNLISKAKESGYLVNLIFFWIESVELAEKRVQIRVSEGGHNIPKEIIRRRYYRGLKNLFNIYHEICDIVLIYDNSKNFPELVYEKVAQNESLVHNQEKFNKIKAFLI
ncbi:MAG: zeta toxin family protein [Bacteroidetes bacterium]|nr:zeta toxin family protein [Bacteroidota bacterium]